MTGVELITLTGDDEKESDTKEAGNGMLYAIGAVCVAWFLYAITRKPL